MLNDNRVPAMSTFSRSKRCMLHSSYVLCWCTPMGCIVLHRPYWQSLLQQLRRWLPAAH